MAVCSHRAEVLQALTSVSFLRAVTCDIALANVPGISRISLFAWPEPPGHPVRIGIDIVRVDDAVLDAAIVAGFTLELHEQPPRLDDVDDGAVVISAADLDDSRPEVLRIAGAEWQLITQGGPQREVGRLDADGRPVFHEVDTRVFCYRLLCPHCGRSRYAKRNGTHEVRYCRVCTQHGRRRRRAVAQYIARAKLERRRRLTPAERAWALNQLAGAPRGTATAVARTLGVRPSAISKLAKRMR